MNTVRLQGMNENDSIIKVTAESRCVYIPVKECFDKPNNGKYDSKLFSCVSLTHSGSSSKLINATSSVLQEKIKPRNLPYYHGMKSKTLREMCKSEGLSTSGTDTELKSRHQYFLLLWNAECDAMYPRSKNELISEFTRREKNMLNFHGENKDHMCVKKLKESRKILGDPEILQKSEMKRSFIASSGNVAFDQKLNDGFKNLIAKVKNKNISEKRTHKFLDKIDKSEESEGFILNSHKKVDVEFKAPQKQNQYETSNIPSVVNFTKKNPSDFDMDFTNHHVLQVTKSMVENHSIDYQSKVVTDNFNYIKTKPTFGITCNVLGCEQSMNQHPQKVQHISTTLSQGKSICNKSSNNKILVQSEFDRNKINLLQVHSTSVLSLCSNQTPILFPKVRSACKKNKDIFLGKWKCSKCTYINELRNWKGASCEMCGSRRSALTKAKCIEIV